MDFDEYLRKVLPKAEKAKEKVKKGSRDANLIGILEGLFAFKDRSTQVQDIDLKSRIQDYIADVNKMKQDNPEIFKDIKPHTEFKDKLREFDFLTSRVAELNKDLELIDVQEADLAEIEDEAKRDAEAQALEKRRSKLRADRARLTQGLQNITSILDKRKVEWETHIDGSLKAAEEAEEIKEEEKAQTEAIEKEMAAKKPEPAKKPPAKKPEPAKKPVPIPQQPVDPIEKEEKEKVFKPRFSKKKEKPPTPPEEKKVEGAPSVAVASKADVTVLKESAPLGDRLHHEPFDLAPEFDEKDDFDPLGPKSKQVTAAKWIDHEMENMDALQENTRQKGNPVVKMSKMVEDLPEKEAIHLTTDDIIKNSKEWAQAERLKNDPHVRLDRNEVFKSPKKPLNMDKINGHLAEKPFKDEKKHFNTGLKSAFAFDSGVFRGSDIHDLRDVFNFPSQLIEHL